MKYVWYLSYGSNMNEKRFMCYINGDHFPGSEKGEQGCKDNTPPIDIQNVRIENQLYFAHHSKKWQGMGIAFLSQNKDEEAHTFAKMYLITQAQFEDIVKQENHIDVYDSIDIDYATLDKEMSVDLFENSLYGRLMKVKSVDGIPVYTFTISHEPSAYSKPSLQYLTTILIGIKHNFKDIDEALLKTFMSVKGVKHTYSKKALKDIISKID